MSDFADGDAKWFFAPVTVTSSTTYTYSHWYKTDAPTQLVAEYTLANNSKSYSWLGTVTPNTDWTQKTVILNTPADAVKVTVPHVIKGNGTLDTDDYSLIQN